MGKPLQAPALTVIFDGVCGLCESSVRFILARDSKGRVAFVAAQSEVGQALQAELGISSLEQQTLIVVKHGRVLLRSDAAIEIIRYLDGPWRLLRGFALVPRPIRDMLYSWIARNRYRWFGRRESCALPSEQWRDRFLG